MATESKQEAILRRVRGLLAKAASTQYEGERQVFMEKADALMEEYAISEVMLKTKDESKARLIVRKDMDVSWYWELRDIDRDARSEIYWLWQACVTQCRCYGGTFATYSANERTVATYGIPTDLEYLSMLFTDLFSQMVAKLKPSYDPSKTMGYNIAVAKAAGMKYADIARWMGRDDWVDYRGKPCDHGIMARAYKQHVKENGEQWITTNPGTYQWSFVSGFCSTVSRRMREMQGERAESHTGSMALALRDVREMAKEALWDDFPSLRPHPTGCTCKECKSKTRLTYRTRNFSGLGNSAGHKAGESARILSGQGTLRQRKQIDG